MNTELICYNGKSLSIRELGDRLYVVGVRSPERGLTELVYGVFERVHVGGELAFAG
jgi:hypothetical protein